MIYFVTGNKGKFVEAKIILPGLEQLEADLTEIQGSPEEIIKYKLKQAYQIAKKPVVVEDTSLEISAFGGLPGPYIKDFLKTLGCRGISNICLATGKNKAVFRSFFGYFNGDLLKVFASDLDGEIVSPKGENGFGWDPIFRPADSEKTFGEMLLEEKIELSPRRRALEKLSQFTKTVK